MTTTFTELVGAYGAWLAVAVISSLSLVAGWAVFTKMVGDDG